VWHDSFICVTWLVHTCDMTRSYMWHDSTIHVTWLVHVCNMTPSCVWNDGSALQNTHTHPHAHAQTTTCHHYCHPPTCALWCVTYMTYTLCVTYMNTHASKCVVIGDINKWYRHWCHTSERTHTHTHAHVQNDAWHEKWVIHKPPKCGVIALWLNTRAVKCKYYVSPKKNGFNNKIHWYGILVTFVFKFTAKL